MNTLIYLFAALFSGGLALRSWSSDRSDPPQRAFTLLGALLSMFYLLFALYLLTGLTGLRYLHVLLSALVPGAAGLLLQRLLGEERERPIPAQEMLLAGAALSLLCVPVLIGQSAGYYTIPLPFPDLPVTLWSFGGLLWCMRWLWRRFQAASDQVRRARIRYIAILLSGAVTLSLVESGLRFAARWSEQPVEGSLQGTFPPVSAMLAAWLMYILYLVVKLYRLIDLQETFTRALALAGATLVLLVANGVGVYWVGGLAASQLHGSFQIFLITLAFLAVFGLLRDRLELLLGQWLNWQGQRMEMTLQEADQALAKVISLQELEEELLGRLHASGRVPVTSLYLWDQGAFRLTLARGVSDRAQMRSIADRPFTDGFRAGARFYRAAELQRRVDRRLAGHEEAAGWLRTMEAMEADLTLPILSGDLVLGWLNLKGDEWAEGFSQDEIRRLQRIVERTAVVLENLRGFEQLKEQHRLAALGTMAAGLAHEIRNPLAGIKGAAQYLQGDASREEVADFVSLIVEETDRLGEVVSQFLLYARPFEVRAQPTDARDLVERTLGLVRAEGHPDSVELRAEIEPDLPAVPLDRDRIQQVLLNLVHNALQAVGSRGQVLIRVRRGHLQGRQDAGAPALVIEVADDGPGIAPEDKEKLFIPFFTTKPQGTGLGLAISRRLVETHGGEIAARSIPGQGAAFTVRLPLGERPRELERRE